VIWLILCFVCLIAFCIVKDEDTKFMLCLFCFVLYLISIVAINHGIRIYPYLIKLKTQAESIKSEISNIRNAYYLTKNCGKLMAGSIENFKQSTNLSQYIQKYAELKAKYNSDLKYYQTIKKMWVHKLFTYGFFISNKIYELEELK